MIVRDEKAIMGGKTLNNSKEFHLVSKLCLTTAVSVWAVQPCIKH